ncbi:MAG TPA: serine hydrolase, partial [Actinoplanes sp.]
MSANFTRRSALGLGAATLGAVGLTEPAAASARLASRLAGPEAIQATYEQQKATAGGTWHTHIAGVDAAGAIQPIVADDADHVTYGYSVQKLAVATAVLDKIDRDPELTRGTMVTLPNDPAFILGGTGIYFLHQVWGDQITIANFLTAMLLVSDNTAVRLCGLVVPAAEINEILAAKGFVH